MEKHERKALKEARNAQGLRQDQLGELVGIDKSYISHIELGTKTPTATIMGRIAAVLGVPVTVLFADELAPSQDKPA